MPIEDDTYDKQYRKERLDNRHKVVNLFNLTKPADTNADKPKVDEKYSRESTDKLFIQTLNPRKKKKRFGELYQDEVDNAEVGRAFGGSGEGVTRVESHNYVYDSQTGWQET